MLLLTPVADINNAVQILPISSTRWLETGSFLELSGRWAEVGGLAGRAGNGLEGVLGVLGGDIAGGMHPPQVSWYRCALQQVSGGLGLLLQALHGLWREARAWG